MLPRKAINHHILALVLAIFITSMFSFTAQAASCKGKPKSSCSADSNCSWVDAYKRKDGVKVTGHCRASTGKSSSKSSSKSTSKKSSNKKADSKSKGKNNKEVKGKSDNKKKKSKKDKDKDKDKKAKKDKKDKKSAKDTKKE